MIFVTYFATSLLLGFKVWGDDNDGGEFPVESHQDCSAPRPTRKARRRWTSAIFFPVVLLQMSLEPRQLFLLESERAEISFSFLENPLQYE